MVKLQYIVLTKVSLLSVQCKKKMVICLPIEHSGVFKNSLTRVLAFQIELEFGSVDF